MNSLNMEPSLFVGFGSKVCRSFANDEKKDEFLVQTGSAYSRYVSLIFIEIHPALLNILTTVVQGNVFFLQI